MSLDNFEQKLLRRPMRTVPAEWRREIVVAALAERGKPVAATPRSTPAVTAWWQQLLWPSPFAWGGLACVWTLIALLHFSTREPGTVVVRQMAPTQPELRDALTEQRRLLAELIGPPPSPAEAPKPPPGPSSQLNGIVTAV